MKAKRPRIRKGIVVASTNYSTYYQIKSLTVEHRYNPMTYKSLGRVLHNTQTL